MEALPMPPASHRCRKSHCSSKSARSQNWSRCDLTDHCTGSEQAVGARDPRGGLWRRQPHVSPNGAELLAEAAQHLCPAWAPAAAKPTSLLLGQTIPGTNPLGKLLTPGQLTATTDLPQTAGLLPPCLARGTVTLGIRPYFPCASRGLAQSVARSYTWAVCCCLFLWISQPLASLMHPGHSAFELQHFLELAPSK